jgi:2-polyprenyl-3-methyl-5-hydroxy-6-metoxy-1,4-benzoquinol methylase/uncharacterized protein YbaR (Trm112 family)
MQRDILPLLACPSSPTESFPLRVLTEFTAAPDGELIEAILVCEQSARWYRVEEGVPDLVRDDLREWDRDAAFLTRLGLRSGEGILAPYQPTREPTPSDDDRRIVDEGRHWGAFMEHFWRAGDRAMFDLRAVGTHPPFYLAGILERDDRDTWRPFGFFPRRAGELYFPWMEQLAGKRAVDVGCGGGQFGLEAARRGLRVISFDPAFQAIVRGREHARATGVLHIDYIRAEPAAPPFQSGVFDVLLAKDSLHHVPQLPAVFEGLLRTATPEAHVLVHEHAEHARLKRAILNRLMPFWISKIRRRYPSVEIPQELLRDSANEDVSSHLIRGVLDQHAECLDAAESLFFAEDVERAVHLAYGKRRWFTRLVGAAAKPVEWLLLALGDRQHLGWHGVRRSVKR